MLANYSAGWRCQLTCLANRDAACKLHSQSCMMNALHERGEEEAGRFYTFLCFNVFCTADIQQTSICPVRLMTDIVWVDAVVPRVGRMRPHRVAQARINSGECESD